MHDVFSSGLLCLLSLAFVLFLIGFLGIIVSKSIVKIVFSFCFMIIGVNINFVLFSQIFATMNSDGIFISALYILIPIFAVIIAFSLFYLLHRQKDLSQCKSIDLIDKNSEKFLLCSFCLLAVIFSAIMVGYTLILEGGV